MREKEKWTGYQSDVEIKEEKNELNETRKSE